MVSRPRPSPETARLRGGGPRLDAVEWLVLLDLVNRFPIQTGPAFDDALAEVSRVLAGKAGKRGAAREGSVLRSTSGLRRRLTVIRALASGDRRRAPAVACEIWDLYLNEPGACAAAVADALKGRDTFIHAASPPWTRMQEILALSAYLRIRPSWVTTDNPFVVELLEILQALGRDNIEAADHDAASIVRKMNQFRAAETLGFEESVGPATLWSEFLDDPASILAAAEAGRAKAVAASRGQALVSPSRGPSPSVGIYQQLRCDGAHFVYVMLLCDQPGPRRWFKIGRSNELDRRVIELNSGFPPGLGLRWTLIANRPFATAEDAHRVEQQTLDRLARFGYAIGREYFDMPIAVALNALSVEAVSERDEVRASGA